MEDRRQVVLFPLYYDVFVHSRLGRDFLNFLNGGGSKCRAVDEGDSITTKLKNGSSFSPAQSIGPNPCELPVLVNCKLGKC